MHYGSKNSHWSLKFDLQLRNIGEQIKLNMSNILYTLFILSFRGTDNEYNPNRFKSLVIFTHFWESQNWVKKKIFFIFLWKKMETDAQFIQLKVPKYGKKKKCIGCGCIVGAVAKNNIKKANSVEVTKH